jgi:hypothetical protein
MSATRCSMRSFIFTGKVQSNMGRFANEITLPSRSNASVCPPDWPSRIEPGTLNVRIDADGFPTSFNEIGSSDGLKKLDEGRFAPAFVIPHDAIRGNTLPPKSNRPLRGTGQAWRARITVCGTGASHECWMFRRIGSTLRDQIELVSEQRIRSVLNLNQDGTPVTVEIIEGEERSPALV